MPHPAPAADRTQKHRIKTIEHQRPPDQRHPQHGHTGDPGDQPQRDLAALRMQHRPIDQRAIGDPEHAAEQ